MLSSGLVAFPRIFFPLSKIETLQETMINSTKITVIKRVAVAQYSFGPAEKRCEQKKIGCDNE